MMHMEGIPEEFKPAAKRAAGGARLLVVMGIITATCVPASILMKHPEQWMVSVISFVGILTLHIVAAFFSHRQGQQRLLEAMRRVPDLLLAHTAQQVQVICYQFSPSGKSDLRWYLGIRSADLNGTDGCIPFRILAPLAPPEIPEPVVAEYYEEDDIRVVRLEDGTLVLLDSPQQVALPNNAWLTPPPRPMPWLVWAQMLSLNGTIAITLPIAAIIWILVLKVAITEWPYAHLPLLFLPGMAMVAALGWFFTWISVAMPIMNLQYYRRLRDAAFGRARLLEAQPFGIQRPGQKVTLHLRIRDENGMEYEQSLITQAPHRWQPNTEIPVLFDPQQRLEPIKLEDFTGLKSYYGSLDFCKIDAQGRIVTDAKAVVTSVICLAIGLAPGYGAVILALKAIGH